MREITFVFPLFVGLLFLVGKGIVFGAEGSEPTTLPFPQNTIVGWLFIGMSILWVFPPWTVARISRTIKKLIKKVYQKEEKHPFYENRGKVE